MMGFKQSVEDHPAIVIALAVIAGFGSGWAAHVAVQQASQLEAVRKESYVLKSDLDSGESKLYVRKELLERSQDALAKADARLAALAPTAGASNARVAPTVAIRDFPWGESPGNCRLRASKEFTRLGIAQFPSRGGETVGGINGLKVVVVCDNRTVTVAGVPEAEVVALLGSVRSAMLGK